MAKFVYNNGSVTINSVDLSDHITSVTVTQTFDDVPTTSIADSAVTRVAGNEDGSVSLTFQHDFAASKIDATINALVGTLTTVVVKADAGATASTNPTFTGSCLVTEFPHIDGRTGELMNGTVTWPVSGGWTRAEA